MWYAADAMIRSSIQTRPIQRLLLVGLMAFALASRLALGAVVPTGVSPVPDYVLAKLQAAMILCHTGQDRGAPPPPHTSSPDDLLLTDQIENAHALANDPIEPASIRRYLQTSCVAPPPTTVIPRPWRSACQPRGPPTTI